MIKFSSKSTASFSAPGYKAAKVLLPVGAALFAASNLEATSVEVDKASTSVEELNWEEIIERSIGIKNQIVSADPMENGLRKILNFGHNIGHAIEGYFLSVGKEILHGQAVATGILLESKLSRLSVEEKDEINSFLQSTFEIINLPYFEDLLPFLENDKKNEKNELNFSLLSKIGKCNFDCKVDIPKIKALF